jgi:hypothetical protein
MFDRALGYERELGLNLWDDRAPWGDGVRLDFCTGPGELLLTLEGRFHAPGQAIDQRLKYAAWMEELERRGGELRVEPVAPADLDGLAEQHELVCVAAGRGGLAELFERDPARSRYAEPQRQLALLVLHGVRPWPDTGLRSPLKFSFSAEDGELFWIPFLDRSRAACRSLLFEARPGGRMDRFREVATGEEMIEVAQAVVAEFFPWESRTIADVTLTDPLAWARGALTPTVRRPAGVLPSGRAVMAVGDSVVLNDPIAGQGSNCASKMARFLAERIDANRGRPYDTAWIEMQFEEFWGRDAQHITAFSNLLLEPLGPAARDALLAGSCSSAVADAIFTGFDEPQRLWPWIEDRAEARRFAAATAGTSWRALSARARARTALGRAARRIVTARGRKEGP